MSDDDIIDDEGEPAPFLSHVPSMHPIKNVDNGKQALGDIELREERSYLLAELSILEVKQMVDIVCIALVDSGVGLPPEFQMPQF
jgi:hypothetical protein